MGRSFCRCGFAGGGAPAPPRALTPTLSRRAGEGVFGSDRGNWSGWRGCCLAGLPLGRPFPLTLTLSHGGDHCKTLVVDRQWFLIRDSYIPCERKGQWLSPGWVKRRALLILDSRVRGNDGSFAMVSRRGEGILAVG